MSKRRRPGIFLDRDGTINVDYHYVGLPERVQLIPGVADTIARFNRAGIPVIIVTNQSGVARGFYTEHDVHITHQYIAAELARHGAHIDLFLYSPHHREAVLIEYNQDSYYHKPNIGMAVSASWSHNIDLNHSVVVGDRESDMEFAHRIGAQGIYLGRDKLSKADPPHVPFASLADAAGYIIERITGVKLQSTFPSMNYTSMLSYFTHYADEIRDVLSNIELANVEEAATILMRAYDGGSFVYTAGNGGAASLANHFECDHTKHLAASGSHGNSSWFNRVRSLSANIEVLTMVANDIGYDAIYSWQLEQHATRNDVLVVFSVSGNSANIIRALQCAREIGMETIAIVAANGGKAATMADIPVHIPSSNYGVAEDVMQMIMHSIAQYIRQYHMSDQQIRSATF